jgi:hypothetical protein
MDRFEASLGHSGNRRRSRCGRARQQPMTPEAQLQYAVRAEIIRGRTFRELSQGANASLRQLRAHAIHSIDPEERESRIRFEPSLLQSRFVTAIATSLQDRLARFAILSYYSV